MIDTTKNIQLFLGDCLEVMKEIPDKSIDLVLTDPPYGTTNISWDTRPDINQMWKMFRRVLSPTGLIVITCNHPFTSELVLSNLPWFKYSLVWNKAKCGSPGLAKLRPMRTHEDILVFSPTTGTKSTYNPQMTEGEAYFRAKPKDVKPNRHGYGFVAKKDSVNEGVRYPKSVLNISRDFSAQQQVHPTQKPVPLMEWLLLTYSNERDIVLDPYMGSGTTGVARKQLNRRFIGIEISEEYMKIAQERIKNTKLDSV